MSNTIISVICVVLIVIVIFYFVAVSCASGAYVGTTDALKKCGCMNCKKMGCANCPNCPKKIKEDYVGGYMSLGSLDAQNYTMPTYPMLFGEQGPPSAIEPENVTNNYMTMDHQEDLLLRELKAPDNLKYIHGFIGSKYNNNKLLYDGVW